MKRKLFTLVMASFAVLYLLNGCSKKGGSTPVVVPPVVVTPVTLKATAIIDAGTTQQTIQGFRGNSILAWIADLTSDQRIKAFSPTTGIGLSILRVMVPDNSSKFAAENPLLI